MSYSKDILLPKVIDTWDEAWKPKETQNDIRHAHLRIELVYVINEYISDKLITWEQGDSLKAQLRSEDKENWLIAFMIIDNLNPDKK